MSNRTGILAATALTLCFGLSARVEAAPLVVNDNGLRISRVCKNDNVVINGNRNVIILRGRCANLSVNGNNNIVKSERVSNIAANGNNNKITYRIGSPNIANPGNSNSVRRSK